MVISETLIRADMAYRNKRGINTAREPLPGRYTYQHDRT